MNKPLIKKIYYHDTDAGGVVYYANYLKYLEEARTEFLSEYKIYIKDLALQGIYFAVIYVELEYKSAVRYGEEIFIFSRIQKIDRVRIEFYQEIKKGDATVLSGKVVLVCIDKNFKLQRIPMDIAQKLSMVMNESS